eukprot:g1394.t1
MKMSNSAKEETDMNAEDRAQMTAKRMKFARHRASSTSFHIDAPRPIDHRLSKKASEGHLLHEAFVGDQTGVKKLLLTGVDVNCRDEECKSTPLHHAAKCGHIHVAETLIAHGADVNAVDEEGETPLHEACDGGNALLVRLFLEHGAKINLTDKMGWTPLHNAAGCDDHHEIVSLLLEKGAKPWICNRAGDTAQQLASKNNHEKSFELLRNASRENSS